MAGKNQCQTGSIGPRFLFGHAYQLVLGKLRNAEREKSFSQRRKDRRKGRKAAGREKRTVGCNEPPKGRANHGGEEPKQ